MKTRKVMSEDQQENGTSNGEVPEIELIIKVSIALDCTNILCLKGKVLQNIRGERDICGIWGYSITFIVSIQALLVLFI